MNPLKTEIIENTWLTRGDIGGFSCDYGWGNGYVFLPEGHPLFGKSYNDINHFVNVHGGLTFGELTEDCWKVGFDTAHYNDTLAEWPKERVEEETQNLERQLEDVISIYREIIEQQEEKIKTLENVKTTLRDLLSQLD